MGLDRLVLFSQSLANAICLVRLRSNNYYAGAALLENENFDVRVAMAVTMVTDFRLVSLDCIILTQQYRKQYHDETTYVPEMVTTHAHYNLSTPWRFDGPPTKTTLQYLFYRQFTRHT